MTEDPGRTDNDVRGPEQNSQWGKIKQFFSDNPAFALTLMYLYVTGVGIIYSAGLYGSFRINIFDYSDIGDFLLAAFKNPSALLLSGLQLAAGLLYLFLMSDVRVWSKFSRVPRDRGGRFTTAVFLSQPILFALASIALPWSIGAQASSSILDGKKPEVEVQYRSFKGSAGQVTVSGLQLIGATQKAAFFYDADDKRTIVIPQSQLVSIEVPEQD